jgi:hypothetical protein
VRTASIEPMPASAACQHRTTTSCKESDGARFFVRVVRVIPKVGPFKVLGFRTPTDETGWTA